MTATGQFGKPAPIIVFLLILSVSIRGFAGDRGPDRFDWQELETRYTVVRYQSQTDLETFNAAVDFGSGQWLLKAIFSDTDPVDLESKIIEKTDALYERVQDILDMRKAGEKVKIHLYPNRSALDDAYRKTYGKDSHIRAWYIFEYNTIYLHVDDVNEGMLAHEMAHAIIDHYLEVRPPAASAEILSRYVDKHLHK